MKLEKNGNVIELDNPIHIDAFLTSGYKKVREQVIPAPKPDKKEVKKPTTRKKKV